MSTVDIKYGYRQYSEQEILDLSYKGLLVCGDYELSDFLSYLMTGIDEIIEERIQAERERWESEWSEEDGGTM